MESRETESTTEALETEQALDREETTSTVLSDKEMQEISKQSAERVEEKLKRIASTDEQTAIRTTDSPASKGTHEGAVRGEVSASTVARMMGLATANEVAMLEGKIDLLSSRVSNATTKLERLFSVLDRLPTAADMDRVDINVGSLKTLIRESLERMASQGQQAKGGEGDSLKKATIMSNVDE